MPQVSDIRIYTTSEGAFRVNTAGLDTAQVKKLDALAATGMMQELDLVTVLGDAPDAYCLAGAGSELKAPNGPEEEVEYVAIMEDIYAMLSKIERDLAEQGQAMRNSAVTQQWAENKNVLAHAASIKQKELEANKREQRAALTTALGEIAGGIVQARGAKNSAKTSLKSMKANEKVDFHTNDLKQVKAARDSLPEAKLKLHNDAAIAHSKAKTPKEHNDIDNQLKNDLKTHQKVEDEYDTVIANKEHNNAKWRRESDHLLNVSRMQNTLASAQGQMVTGIGKAVSTGDNGVAGQLRAEAKEEGVAQEVDTRDIQINGEFASSAKELVADMIRKGHERRAASEQLASSIAHNM